MVPGENTQMVPVEVDCSAADEPRALCIIRDKTSSQTLSPNVTLNLPASTTAVQLMEEVGRQCCYCPDSFELILQSKSSGDAVPINEQGDLSLEELGFQVGNNARNNLVIFDRNGEAPRKMVVPESNWYSGRSLRHDIEIISRSNFSGDSHGLDLAPSSKLNYYTESTPLIKEDSGTSGYIGLVNQAMTCYLNSLLQTLYMTPEFRNALYRWEFDGTEEEGVKSIPFQLQKLFLQLQISAKPAIGTTDLTTSFGWDSSEAWQQHDVQELCRVMFDALEQKFKNTDQADLISRLYEGKLKDYVKCLECGSESAREDTFLDVPLVVRPFGSNQSYGSVEEALKAFVTPETLEGCNQYHCERCSKKCDAHKGLKFTRFPYLLTLQLKRFDFDPVTMHRIKLNDKVTFPETLNLNEFIKVDTEQEVNDDGDTTDSGSALDDDASGFAVGSKSTLGVSSDALSYYNSDEDDEGIDVGQSAGANCSEVTVNEKNLKKSMEKGPYAYELFSIMVHSGSANGGHYYAYIKSFKDGQWYCFNDAQVTKITYDDIRKTYGGGPSRGGYYFNTYSSSTNAYMLMYRQINKDLNAEPMMPEDFPEHIKALLQSMRDEEERERQQRELDRSMCRIKLFCQHSTSNSLREMRLKIHKDATLQDATATAHKICGLEGIVPLDCCRLVKYDEFHDSLDCSFEDYEDQPIGDILGGVKSNYKFDLLLEIKKPYETFQPYKPGGTTVKVHVIDLDKEEILSPVTVRGHLSQTVEEFQKQIAQTLGFPSSNMRIVLEKYYNDLRLLTSPHKTLKAEGFYRSNKVFVEYKDEDDSKQPFSESHLFELLDRYEHTICINVSLPIVDKAVLERLRIPANNDSRLWNIEDEGGTGHAVTSNYSADLPKNQQVVTEDSQHLFYDDGEFWVSPYSRSQNSQSGGVHSDQSEDSSLTDSERTLVGEEFSPLNNSPDFPSAEMEHEPESQQLLARGTGYSGQKASAPESDSLNNSSDSSPQNEYCEDDRNLSSPEENMTSCRTSVQPESHGCQCVNQSDKDLPMAEGDEWEEALVLKKEEPKRFFRAWPHADPNAPSNEKTLKVYVDKRITLGALKKDLEPFVGVPSSSFKVYRLYSNNQEFECTRLAENLMTYGEDSKLIVKLGRALRKGEYRVKIYRLCVNDPEPITFLIDWIFTQGMTVLQAKKEILPEIRDKCKLDIPLNRCRLRKKSWKNPSMVYLDNMRFEQDIPIFSNWEVFLEVLTEAEKVTSSSCLAIYVRRWHPSTYTLDPLVEVVLEERTVEELKEKLSALSEIPGNHIEFVKCPGTFPCEVSVLTVHTELEWHSHASSLNSWPLGISEDGHVVLYRDNTQELKQLSEEEKREISNKENARVRKMTKVSCSPRKERALKIYTDSPPSQSNTCSTSIGNSNSNSSSIDGGKSSSKSVPFDLD